MGTTAALVTTHSVTNPRVKVTGRASPPARLLVRVDPERQLCTQLVSEHSVGRMDAGLPVDRISEVALEINPGMFR